jgi:hypothetical protein
LLWIPDPPEDHPFFDTDPEHDVEEADDVFQDILLNDEVPGDMMDLLHLQARREMYFQAAWFYFNLQDCSQCSSPIWNCSSSSTTPSFFWF